MVFFQNKRICDRILAFSGIKIRSICFSFIFSPFSGSFYHIMLFHSIKILRDRRFFMVLYIQHKISPFCLLEASLRTFRSGFSLLCVKPAIRRNVTQINLMRSLLPLFLQKVRLNHRFSLFRRWSFQADIEKIIVRQKHRDSHGGDICKEDP